MCLTLRKNHNRPYNRGFIRWKLVRVGPKGGITTPYQDTRLHAKKYNYAKKQFTWDFEGEKWSEDPRISGFHVFTSKRTADEHRECWVHIRTAKVLVKGFKASGTFDCLRSETWSKLRIIKIY